MFSVIFIFMFLLMGSLLVSVLSLPEVFTTLWIYNRYREKVGDYTGHRYAGIFKVLSIVSYVIVAIITLKLGPVICLLFLLGGLPGACIVGLIICSRESMQLEDLSTIRKIRIVLIVILIVILTAGIIMFASFVYNYLDNLHFFPG